MQDKAPGDVELLEIHAMPRNHAIRVPAVMLAILVLSSIVGAIPVAPIALQASAQNQEQEEVYRRYSEIAPFLAYRIKTADIPLVAE